MGSRQKTRDIAPSGPRALWPVDLKITHLDWNPEATLIHFQGQYLTICELDYNILQGEIQNVPKARTTVDIGEFCLVEDLTSARWYRGRVQNRKKDLFDVFLIDHGNVLSVDEEHISSCSNDLFILPPKIVCGFLSSVLLLPGCCHSVVEQYFSNLIGRNFTGYIQALLPHKVLLLEAPDINSDLVRHGFGRHVDTDTFLLLVEMLTEAPLKQNIEPAPDLLIEKKRGQEFFFKDPNPTSLQGYENILSFSGPRLKCGTQATVQVTAAVNPGLFYCQMANKEADLKELSSKLAAACELKAKLNQQKTPDNLGLLCSVKGKDEKWYRGFVQHLPVNSLVRVLFVDYGYIESVRVENIYRLPPNFYSTPIMAFPCALSCVNDEDQSIMAQQLSFLKSGLLGGVLEVEINKFKEEQPLYYITICNAKDRLAPTPTEDDRKVKVGNSESERERNLPQGGHLFYETVMREELDKTLEDEEVQVGSVFFGYVEHVQNPNHFWIRTEKRNEEFEEMMEKLSDHFSNVKLDEDVLENPEPGTLCCAVYEEDMHYYRGVVIDTLEHGAEVLFIDFGNIEKVPHKLIKKIPEEFADKSAFALCCNLVNVVPIDEVWTSSASDSFRRLVSYKVLQVHVVQMRKNKFDVDLYEMGSGGVRGQSISELLISSNLAEYGKNISKQFARQNKKLNPQNEKVPRQNNATKSQQLQDCNKVEKATKDETERPKGNIRLKALNIKPGCEFAVYCPLINSPSDFWCQRLNKVPALETLMTKLQQHYSTNTVPLEPETSSCVAKMPHDGKWCRAIITERQNGQASVILVDFGTSIQVKEECLQGLLPEYVDLEGQAFRCSLYNLIEPPALAWSQNASEFLRRFVGDSGSNLKCKVVSQLNVKNKGLCNVVDLYNSDSNQSISNLLLEQLLARKGSTNLSPAMFPESFVYSSYDLNVGCEEQVFVTHVNSHFEVFCQLEKNTAIIEEIDTKISEEVTKVEQANMAAVVKKLCLAKYLDGMWYRGIAYSAQSPSHLCVAFVDYGNTMIAEKKHVIFISRDSADLLYTPMQALRFSLAWVPQDQVFADVKEWLDTAVLNKQVRAVVVGKRGDGSFEVELLDGEVSINDRLKELINSLTPKPKIAVTFNTTTKKKQNVQRKDQPKGKTLPTSNNEKRTSYHNNRLNTNRWNNNRTGPVKSPQMKGQPKKVTDAEEKNKSPNKTPLKPKTTSKVEAKRKFDEINPEQTKIFSISCSWDKKLTEGLKAECFASHIDSLTSFFLQLSGDEADILKIAKDLNSSSFRDTLQPSTDSLLKTDALVFAEYEEDGALYRAVVKENVGFCNFRVEFVDFGNSAIMDKKKIYLITKDYISQPRYSIPCSLMDLTAFENTAAFINAVMDKPLMVEFVRLQRSQWQVKIEILDAAPSLPCETPAQKETVPAAEVKRPTLVETKQKAKKYNGKNFKKKTKKKSANAVLKDLVSVFMPPKIQSGDTEIGLVLSVQNNGDFYVRLGKTMDRLAALEALIAVNLNKCELVSKNCVKDGLTCLVQGQEDGPWHRAVVQEVICDTCLVLLLDHGKMETIPKGSLRQMMSNLAIIPPFAVQCRLNLLGFSEKDSQTCHEVVKPIAGKEVKLVFVEFSEKDQLWLVEVIINGLFLMHHVSTPERQIQNPIAETETPCDTILDIVLPQKLSFAPVELNKEYSGFAAAVTTPFEFCIVLENLHLMSQVSILLDDLQDELLPLPQDHLVPRTGCLVKSDSKNKWCRAELLQADSTIVLNLVDYGHDECLSYEQRSKLKKLPESMAKLPKVTYPCLLKGVRPVGVDGQWTDEAAVFFQQCLDQRNLQIFFREAESDCQWKVDVLANGVHVAKQLVDAGHASYTDIMLGLRFQEQNLRRRSEEECDEDADEASSRAFEEVEEQIFKVESDSNLCMLM